MDSRTLNSYFAHSHTVIVRAHFPSHWFLAFLTLLALFPRYLNAEATGVIYPTVSKPLQRVFSEIKSGIVSDNGKNISLFKLDDETTAVDFSNWQKKVKLQRLIVLGNRAKKFVESQPDSVKALTFGAIRKIKLNRQQAAVSIIPAPKSMLSQLLAIAPSVKRVFVIENTSNGNDLVNQAILSGKSLSLEVIVRQAATPQAFAQALKEIIAQMRPGADAFWLSHNAEPINKKLLQQTLVDAWNRNLIIFSSNLADVKRGALFAVFPDNVLMGRQLYELANRKNTTNANNLEYAKHLHIALNRRTASHLGINFSRNDLKLFKLVYPPY